MLPKSWTPFDETIDEALTVIREEFADCIKECRDIDSVVDVIEGEIKKIDPDFIKIIAYCVAGEVLRAG